MNTLSLLSFAFELKDIIAVALFLYVLPGLGLTAWLARYRPLAWTEHLTLAPGISLALYSLIFLWAYALDLNPGPIMAWFLPLTGVSLVFWFSREKLGTAARTFELSRMRPRREQIPDLILLVLVGVLFASRFVPIRLLTEPLWGDSVHHTFITQLIVDNRGLFQSWEPYAPIRSLTYHFGFHIAAAQWVWLTAMPAPQAVLVVGQILNVLAVLALYPLALRLSRGNRWAGLGAVVVAGFLLTMPAYYVNWGRYTQLAGQVMLPALIWLFVMIWDNRFRPSRAFWGVAVLLAVGLAATHYRVAILAAAAGIGWGLWGMWTLRREPKIIGSRLLWLGGAAGLAGLLFLPWIAVIRGSAMEDLFSRVAQRPASNPALARDIAIWLGDVPRFYPILLWVGAPLLLLIALWKQRPLAVPLLLWAAISFLATNPFLIGLPGTGWVSNFLVIIALYIPLALLWGWAGGVGAAWLWKKRFGSLTLVVLLSVLIGWGLVQQVRVVDFFHRMVWPSDRVAFQWIEENTPEDSHFLVNGFSIYTGVMIVGSDGGWWLPYFTRRSATVPPGLYNVERNAEAQFINRIDKVEEDVRASNGDPALLLPVLCRDGITHVYLGERRGTVGVGTTQLLPEEWLRQISAFALLFQEGAAQVWSFDRRTCPGG